jgi:SHS2 domain-containing protein
MHNLLVHTADLKAELEAPDLPALYNEAVTLVRETLVGDSPVAGTQERRLACEGADEAEKFFRFVRELLFIYDVDRFLPAAVRCANVALVTGEEFNPARHRAERQIKALTRHQYEFERTAKGYRAALVFDL